jgi:hypothetical protein
MTPIGSSSWVLPVLGLLGVIASGGRAQGAAPQAAIGEGARETLLPTVGAALGPFWPLSPGGRAGLAVDVTVGAALRLPGHRGASPAAIPPWQLVGRRDEQPLKAALWLQPEFGYSYQRGGPGGPGPGSEPGDPRPSSHLGSLGLGVGYGNLLFLTAAYTPRLVVGLVGDELAVGLRHGLAGHFLGRLFSAELSHQLLVVSGELRHELRLLLGLNAGALLVPWL